MGLVDLPVIDVRGVYGPDLSPLPEGEVGARLWPESTSRRRRAVPENRCRSKFCVDCFHLTLLQHFFPHLNIFRKL